MKYAPCNHIKITYRETILYKYSWFFISHQVNCKKKNVQSRRSWYRIECLEKIKYIKWAKNSLNRQIKAILYHFFKSKVLIIPLQIKRTLLFLDDYLNFKMIEKTFAYPKKIIECWSKTFEFLAQKYAFSDLW